MQSSRQQQQQGQGSPPPPASSCKRPRTAMKPLRPEHRAALRGKYELVSFRGDGSFSEVWEAEHLRTGLRVAIKILCHAKMRDAKLKPEREPLVMRLLSLGRHPHVARFYEAIRPAAVAAGDHQYTYIVMELAESGQLHDILFVRQRLPEAEARRIFQQVAAAVAYCHRNRVAHRNLKMENVLLDAEGRVKIADFGFSKLWSPGKMQSRSLGSLEYAAPELLERHPYRGPEVDVWACGVILYTMLCGRYPFDGTDMSDLRRNIRRGEFMVPSVISDDARDLISSMLIVRPEKRATMAAVMAHRWLQPNMPPYLAIPPPDATAARQGVDAATVELLVTRHRFERTSLLQSIRLDDGSEAAVAYQLVLSKQHDAVTLYQRSMPPPPPHGRHQWALDGGELVLRECPRETMRRVAKALEELGVGILSYHSHRHPMVCAHVRGTGGGGVPTAATIRSFLRRHEDGGSSSSSSSGDAIATATATDDDTAAVERISAAAVFFEIQLLKSGEGNSNDNSQQQQQQHYVLHLKRTSGPQIPYLGVCSQLASKLKSNPY